jgi:AraC-like DNA-binding protein
VPRSATLTLVMRRPCASLRPFVDLLWASAPERVDPDVDRECMLPTGTTHVVIRLDCPVRFYDAIDDDTPSLCGHGFVGGVRSSYYVRDVRESGTSVGAMLRPGACELLLGVPAEHLAGRHTPLGDLWGAKAEAARARIAEAPSPAAQLDAFEAILLEQGPRLRAVHPAVAAALHGFANGTSVAEVVRDTGLSHRRFIEVFHRSVGLTPKLYCRVQRFTRVLDRLCHERRLGAIELALAAGYSDQAHLNREFREFTGVSPGRYRELAPRSAHHLPLRRGR